MVAGLVNLAAIANAAQTLAPDVLPPTILPPWLSDVP